MRFERGRAAAALGSLAAAAVVLAAGCGGKTGGLEIVRKVKVARGDLRVTVSASGEVKPQNRVEIKPSIAGRIEEILVKEGQVVEAGTVLAWMSSTERAALMDSARAQGDAEVARWEEAYKAAPLVAPLSGTIIVRAVEPGQTVSSSDPVVVIADRLIVEALVDETDLSLIRVGQRVEVRLDSYPEERIPAAVDHVAYESKLVNNVSVYAVDILPDTAPDIFRSGMTATVTFAVADREDALLVPSEALVEWPRGVERPEGAQFAVYQRGPGGKLTPGAVRAGQSDGRMTEVLDGLSENDEIVIVRRKESERKKNPFSPNRRPAERPRER